MQCGSLLKVPEFIVCVFFFKSKCRFYVKGETLCRCCPSEAWIAGEVCPQGSQMLPCCLRWCRWILSCLNPEAFKSLCCVHPDHHVLSYWLRLITALQSQCWTSLLTVANSSSSSGIALPAPSPKFLLVCTCSRLEFQSFYFYNLQLF